MDYHASSNLAQFTYTSTTNRQYSFQKTSENYTNLYVQRRAFFLPLSLHQHYSDVRTTQEHQVFTPKKLTDPPENLQNNCFCNMDVPVPPNPSTCEECVQECEESACDLQLTEQCTDQCVVVPCNDAHHKYAACDPKPPSPPSDLTSAEEADRDILESFMQCCTMMPDSRSISNSAVPDPAFAWAPPFSEAMFHGYMAQAHGPSSTSFYSTDSSVTTPQMLPSPNSYLASPQPLTNPLPPLPQSSRLSCMWGHCGQTFATMSDLVGHVNLQHLRLPLSPSPPMGVPRLHAEMGTSYQQYQMDPTGLSCHWADCQVYPTPDSIPGPSSGNQTDTMLGVLATHLLHDHLGLPTRSISNDLSSLAEVNFAQPGKYYEPHADEANSSRTSPSLTLSCPPTPAPEHDCSAPQAHVCGWTGCGQGFPSCDDLTAHINAVHVGSGKAHYDCRWEGCTRHGDNGFASKQKICRHLQSHTGHRPFQCKTCNQNFSEAATLAQHMRRHTQEKPYICDFPGCGKSFAITGALTIHKRTHNGHKPFKCTYCERAFAESSNLSKHLRTHTGARPYSCNEPDCAKSFARPDQLARHMSVHRKRDSKATPSTVPA